VSNILRHAAEWFQLQDGDELMNQTPPTAASHLPTNSQLPNWLAAGERVRAQHRNEAIKCPASTHVSASPPSQASAPFTVSS